MHRGRVKIASSGTPRGRASAPSASSHSDRSLRWDRSDRAARNAPSSGRARRRRAAARRRGRRDRLRHGLRPSPSCPQFYPDEEAALRRHQHVARASLVVPRAQLRARWLDADREHRELHPIIDDVDGDDMQLHQLDDPGRAAWLRPQRHGRKAWVGSRTSCRPLSTRAGGSSGSTCPSRPAAPRSSSSIRWWTRIRSTAGPSDASPCSATPRNLMYPRGSNCAAQAILDARALADPAGRARTSPRRPLRPTRPSARAATAGSCARPASGCPYRPHRASRGAGGRPAFRRARSRHHPGRAAGSRPRTTSAPTGSALGDDRRSIPQARGARA